MARPFPQAHFLGTYKFGIVTPAQRKREANQAKARARLRTAKFRQRAKNMGITEDALISQKVAIWEGIWVAEQNREDIQVSIHYSVLFLRL